MYLIIGYADLMRIPSLFSRLFVKMLVGNIKMPCIFDESLFKRERKFPLLIFSHGLYGMRTTYSGIATEFASQGWIVLMMEHQDGSALVSIDDGKIFPHRPLSNEDSKLEFRNHQLNIRVKEVGLLLSWLKSSSLYDCIDWDKLVIGGHSFGAATSISSCQTIENFKACLILDPWMEPLTFDVVRNPIRHVPSLVLNSYSFQWTANLIVLKEYMEAIHQIKSKDEKKQKDCIIATVRNTGHHEQSDIPLILPSFMAKRYRTRSSLEPIYALRINIHACFSFLNQVVHAELPADSSFDVFNEDDFDRSIDLIVNFRK